MDIDGLTTLIGLLAAFLLLAMLIWSIGVPDKRLWPPMTSTRVNRVVVWALTMTVFGSAIVLGITDWNRFQWPALLRWGIGLPLIVVGNWIAWRGALNLGMEATSGAIGILKPTGFINTPAIRNMLPISAYSSVGQLGRGRSLRCLSWVQEF